jgi:hypothetical protein
MNEPINTPIVPAEVLASFRAMLALDPAFAAIGMPFQVEVILDANVVISDLLWMTRRRNPAARTTLRERRSREKPSSLQRHAS